MDFVNTLKRTDIFYDLSDEQLEMVAGLCHEVHYRMGEMIFEEQSASDELYVIARGEIEILVDPSIIEATSSPRPVTVATMRAGQAFGEIALVDQGLRSAGARSASEDTRLLVVPRIKLLGLCDAHPELGYRVMRNVAADLALKMRGADLTIREQLLWGGRRG
jgi:CRP/FNR family transcriptional regulator, cyclic AMP receptor protein